MSSQPSSRSIFYKVATKEDHYTQLLCNLMQRSDDFRLAVLNKFLGDNSLASQIRADQIDTQIPFGKQGRPDVVVESPILRAAIEVKLDRRRPCTDNQLPPDAEDLSGYCSFLSEGRSAIRRLWFLVPGAWSFLQETDARLKAFKERQPSIDSRIVLWEDILALLKQEQFSRDPLLVEFRLLLEAEFRSVQFTRKEIEMMTDAAMNTRVIFKASYVVDGIAKECKKEEFSFDGPKHDNLGEQYGLEFYRKARGSQGRDASYFFWFGIWSPVWEKHGKAVCFGISHKQAELKVFLQAYSGPTVEHVPEDSDDPLDKWTLGWITESELKEGDPIPKIWDRLKPILYSVLEAAA